MDRSIFIVAAIISIVIIFLMAAVILAPVFAIHNKEKKQRQIFGAGCSADERFHADFSVEGVVSVDYSRHKIRPELFKDCRTIPFKKLKAVQVFRDSDVVVEKKLKGATFNTFALGALMGTPGAIIGACSGTPTVNVYEKNHGWKLVLYTSIPDAERIEIPIPKHRSAAVTRYGSRRFYRDQKLIDELSGELQNLEFEADLDDPEFADI